MATGVAGGWGAKLFGLRDTLSWAGSLVVALTVCLGILFIVRPDRSKSST